MVEEIDNPPRKILNIPQLIKELEQVARTNCRVPSAAHY